MTLFFFYRSMNPRIVLWLGIRKNDHSMKPILVKEGLHSTFLLDMEKGTKARSFSGHGICLGVIDIEKGKKFPEDMALLMMEKERVQSVLEGP